LLLYATKNEATIPMESPPYATLREVARLYADAQRQGAACCRGTTQTQCMFLTEIGWAGQLTLRELAHRLGFDKSWTSRVVDGLVAAGLLYKTSSPDDRRSVLISLTTEGHQRHAELNAMLNAHAERVMHRIPVEKRAPVYDALELLRAALRAENVDTTSEAHAQTAS
jgi:DNA-binding MarR family transcriptional regulator